MFSCDTCGKAFPRKSNLTRHARKHTGEKPYACEFCPKRFARSENRIEHQRTHTKERPYVCEECGASFSDSGNFCNHKKIHSNIKPRKRTNKKPSRTNENALSTVAITNFISNLCTSSQTQDISGAFQSIDSKVVKSSIEPLRINLVRQPSQHYSLEKLKLSPSNESTLPVAYLATSADIEQVAKFTGNEDKTGACNFVTVSGEQLFSKSGRTSNSFSVGNQEQIFGTDLIASIPDFLSSVHSPSGQAYLMLDGVSREINLPFLNDTFLVQNPPLSPYSSSGIINGSTYESLIGDDLSHNQQISPSSEFCLHATQVNYNCDTSLANQISTEGSIHNRNEVRSRNTIGDKYPLDTNTFLNDDYLTNNQSNV